MKTILPCPWLSIAFPAIDNVRNAEVRFVLMTVSNASLFIACGGLTAKEPTQCKIA